MCVMVLQRFRGKNDHIKFLCGNLIKGENHETIQACEAIHYWMDDYNRLVL